MTTLLVASSGMTRLVPTAAAAVLAMVLAMPASGQAASDKPTADAKDPSGMTDKEIADTLRLAWRWG